MQRRRERGGDVLGWIRDDKGTSRGSREGDDVGAGTGAEHVMPVFSHVANLCFGWNIATKKTVEMNTKEIIKVLMESQCESAS